MQYLYQDGLFLAKPLVFSQASLTVMSNGVMTGRTLPAVDSSRSSGVFGSVDLGLI